MQNNFSSKFITQGALIAALYTVLTLAIAPLSSGAIQLRVSEALCILPWLFPAAVPGLFVGCLISNLIMGAPFLDVAVGSLTTLLAAYLTLRLKNAKLSHYLAPLPAIILNAIFVGAVVWYLYSPDMFLPLVMVYVGLGQIGACYVLGMPLLFILKKMKKTQM